MVYDITSAIRFVRTSSLEGRMDYMDATEALIGLAETKHEDYFKVIVDMWSEYLMKDNPKLWPNRDKSLDFIEFMIAGCEKGFTSVGYGEFRPDKKPLPLGKTQAYFRRLYGKRFDDPTEEIYNPRLSNPEDN